MTLSKHSVMYTVKYLSNFFGLPMADNLQRVYICLVQQHKSLIKGLEKECPTVVKFSKYHKFNRNGVHISTQVVE